MLHMGYYSEYKLKILRVITMLSCVIRKPNYKYLPSYKYIKFYIKT